MRDSSPSNRKVLYLIICAAPPAQEIHEFIRLAQARQWDVCAIATPQATRFIDAPQLVEMTGFPVRSDYKLPGEADAFPKADGIVVMPPTFNTINKWVLGIADTLAVGILCEALGRRNIPIMAVPYLKADLAHHPAFPKSIAWLEECDVRVFYEPETYQSQKIALWERILDALNEMVRRNTSAQ